MDEAEAANVAVTRAIDRLCDYALRRSQHGRPAMNHRFLRPAAELAAGRAPEAQHMHDVQALRRANPIAAIIADAARA
jgi:hypothetical protein